MRASSVSGGASLDVAAQHLAHAMTAPLARYVEDTQRMSARIAQQLAPFPEPQGNLARYLEDSQRFTQRIAQELAAMRSLMDSARRERRAMSTELAALALRTRGLAREHKALAVEIGSVLAAAASASGRDRRALPAKVAKALRGDVEARREWQELAEDGDTLALRVLDACARLDSLASSVTQHLARVAATVARLAPVEALPLVEGSPPRYRLAGTIDTLAPPSTRPVRVRMIDQRSPCNESRRATATMTH